MSGSHLPLDMEQFPNHFPLSIFNPILLGVTGYAGSGKDTVAKILSEEIAKLLPIPNSVWRDWYAKPIKMAYLAKWGEVLNFTYEDMDDFEWKKQVNPFTGTTHRQEFQFDGTEGTRNRTGNMNVWVQHLWARNHTKNGVIIVPDTRFSNEVNFTRDSGCLIKVTRPNQEVISTSSHASESICPDGACSFVIVNDGSLSDLKDKVISLVNILFNSDFIEVFRGAYHITDEMQVSAKGIVKFYTPAYTNVN